MQVWHTNLVEKRPLRSPKRLAPRVPLEYLRRNQILWWTVWANAIKTSRAEPSMVDRDVYTHIPGPTKGAFLRMSAEICEIHTCEQKLDVPAS